MSIHIRGSYLQEPESDSHSTSSEDDDDENWDDWISDSAAKPCKSLFDDSLFPSATDALQSDKSKHGFDLDVICKKICWIHYLYGSVSLS
jgi:type I protein arginine methyltransferase